MSWVTDSPSKSHVSDTPPSSPLQAVKFSTADEQIDCTLPPPDWNANKSPSSGLTEHITTGDDSPTHLRTAKSLLGKTVPIATVRNNFASLKALGSLFVSKFQRHRKFLEEKCYTEQLLFETRCLLFSDENVSHLPAGYRDWIENQLKVVRFYIIEFMENYKNLKTGDDIAPTTLKTYMLGIQRVFSFVWDYDLKIFSGPIFACPREGFVGVLDNKARQGQQQGLHVISHNVLSRGELIHLYRSESLSKNTLKGFLTRFVFTVGILTALRPVALATLSVRQFSQLKIGERFVWKITSAIGSNEGASKTARGGWGAIGQKGPEICVWNEAYNVGTINFYEDIEEYVAKLEA